MRALVTIFACCLAISAQGEDLYDVTYSIVMNGVTAVNVVFATDPGPARAEAFLREAMLQAVAYEHPTKDMSGFIWVGKPRNDDNSARMLHLSDGSSMLVYVVREKKIVTEKQYDTTKLSALPASTLINVSISLGARFEAQKFLIIGTSNLPAGMHLKVSIEDASGVPVSQADAVVQKGGQFLAPMKRDQGQWAPATYHIEIISLLAHLQSATVQQIIGQSGQNLTGNDTDVELGERGVHWQGTLNIN